MNQAVHISARDKGFWSAAPRRLALGFFDLVRRLRQAFDAPNAAAPLAAPAVLDGRALRDLTLLSDVFLDSNGLPQENATATQLLDLAFDVRNAWKRAVAASAGAWLAAMFATFPGLRHVTLTVITCDGGSQLRVDAVDAAHGVDIEALSKWLQFGTAGEVEISHGLAAIAHRNEFAITVWREHADGRSGLATLHAVMAANPGVLQLP